MNARERDWIMVRLRRETHAELKSISATRQKAYQRGASQLGSADLEGPSLDTVISDLIRRLRDHEQRSRKSNARKRAKRAAQLEKDREVKERQMPLFDSVGVYTTVAGSEQMEHGG